MFLHYSDIAESTLLIEHVYRIQPVEIYRLAVERHVCVCFDTLKYIDDASALGTLTPLDAIRETKLNAKSHQAINSQMHGKVLETLQKEKTLYYPRRSYTVAKVYAHRVTVNYRVSCGISACIVILFNIESPQRRVTFVARKMSRPAARINAG